MRILRIMFLAALLFLLTGCWVFSLQQTYEDKDLTSDEQLVGAWWQPGAGCTLTVTKDPKEQAYLLGYTSPKTSGENNCLFDPGTKIKLAGHLFHLASREYIDLAPVDKDVCFPCQPLHSAYQVAVQKSSLSLIPLDYNWLDTALSAQTVSADRIKSPDYDLVLTGTTKELQQLYSKYADNDEAFKPNPLLTFQRRPAESTRPARPPRKR